MNTDDGPRAETYTEWRLTGQPPGEQPFYDVTAREDDRNLEDLMVIWSKIRTGEYQWRDAQLRSREVTIIRRPWEDVPLRYDREHGGQVWCDPSTADPRTPMAEEPR